MRGADQFAAFLLGQSPKKDWVKSAALNRRLVPFEGNSVPHDEQLTREA